MCHHGLGVSEPSNRFPGFDVGPVRVAVPLLLAPMEDVTNLAFRLIAKRIARPGLMFTEFVSAMAVHYAPDKATRKMRVLEQERPLGVQIFGGDPGVMARTAQIAEEMGADIVDVNMGCWVPKVCRTGSGAALLKDPALAEEIVSAVVKAVRVPVTVKVRAGWDWSLFAAPDLAKRFQGAGAQMITLHARFAKQGFEGEADWKLINELRKAVTVPLIGNGDVRTPADAERMIAETGCDGVMVGRAAISNPWQLAKVRAHLAGDRQPPDPTLQDRVATAIEHARSMVAFEHGLREWEEVLQLPEPERTQAELRGVRALRGQLPLYIKGYQDASKARAALSRVSSVAEIEDLLTDFQQKTAEAESAEVQSRR